MFRLRTEDSRSSSDLPTDISELSDAAWSKEAVSSIVPLISPREKEKNKSVSSSIRFFDSFLR